jgi:hypothetical protein
VSQRIIKSLEGNREITDPMAIANVFNIFFVNIGNNLASFMSSAELIKSKLTAANLNI